MKKRTEIRQFTCPCEKKMQVDKKLTFKDTPTSANSAQKTEIDIFCPHCGKYFTATVTGDLSSGTTLRGDK